MASRRTTLETLNDVIGVLNKLANTTAVQVRIRAQTTTFPVKAIANVMVIGSYERHDGEFTVHEFSGEPGCKLRAKSRSTAFVFKPKVSDKLPLCDSDSECDVCSSGDYSSASSSESDFATKHKRRRLKRERIFEELLEKDKKDAKKAKKAPKPAMKAPKPAMKASSRGKK